MTILLARTLLAAAESADATRWKGIFGIAALVVAMAGFLAVLAYLFLRRNQATYERARHLPLEDDQPPRKTGETPRSGAGRGSDEHEELHHGES